MALAFPVAAVSHAGCGGSTSTGNDAEAAMEAAVEDSGLPESATEGGSDVVTGRDAWLADSGEPEADAALDSTVQTAPDSAPPTTDAGSDATAAGSDAMDASSDATDSGAAADSGFPAADSGASEASAGTDSGAAAGHCSPPASDAGPLVIAFEQPNPGSLAVDANNLYWGSGSSSGPVTQMPKSGGVPFATPIPLVTGQEYPSALVVDSDYVYFSDTIGNIKRVPIGGGTLQTVATLSGNVDYLLAINDTTLFIAGDEVVSMPKGGGPITPIAPKQYQTWGLTLDRTHLYWSTETLGGAVQEWSIAGGPVTTLAQNLNDPFGVAVDDRNVYFGLISEALIWSVPIDGGPTSPVASQQPNVDDVVVDCGNLYWATYSSILKMPVGGGPVTTIASGMMYPGSIVIDDMFVYWTASFAGTVMKAPK